MRKRRRQAIIDKTAQHFKPVLRGYPEEPAFVLADEDDSIIENARVTDIFFLSRFVEFFGDLIEDDDFSIESYLKRNKDEDLRINEIVFEKWKEAGCLRE